MGDRGMKVKEMKPWFVSLRDIGGNKTILLFELLRKTLSSKAQHPQ